MKLNEDKEDKNVSNDLPYVWLVDIQFLLKRQTRLDLTQLYFIQQMFYISMNSRNFFILYKLYKGRDSMYIKSLFVMT